MNRLLPASTVHVSRHPYACAKCQTYWTIGLVPLNKTVFKSPLLLQRERKIIDMPGKKQLLYTRTINIIITLKRRKQNHGRVPNALRM